MKQTGFTLYELIVFIFIVALGAIVVTGLIAALHFISKFW